MAEFDRFEYHVGSGLGVVYGPVERYVLYSGMRVTPGHWSTAVVNTIQISAGAAAPSGAGPTFNGA